LLEEQRFGRFRFAGSPVSPIRGLLCRDGWELRAWEMFGAWLHNQSSLSWVDAGGIPSAVAGMPRAVISGERWLGFALPDTFAEYLEQQPSRRRREIRRRLRVAERNGLEAKLAESRAEVNAALDLFVRFHAERARSKGERHPAIDGRLRAMLARVSDLTAPDLRLFTLMGGGEAMAVAVGLEHGGQTWSYNSGFAPAAAQHSPGLLIKIASIRDAIERGASWFDFGPGDFPYKRELGAHEYERLRVELCGSTAASQGWRLASLSRKRLREVSAARNVVATLRGLRARALSA
jgi:CelD/BcsL family acetyltransferase involved in cellulose biosynthesis